jgi:VWFA-related protein
MRRAAAIALSLACLASGRASQQAQTPSQPFRTGVDLVQVDVSVLDRDRSPIRGLTASDFTVLEDGKPRPIAAFTPVQLPPPDPVPSAKWMADVRSDVVTNDIPQEGRLVVVLMDRSIRATDMVWARRIATGAIAQLGPDDLGAVAYSVWGIPQNFTADRQRLAAAIQQPFIGATGGDTGSPAECRCGVCSLEAMTRVADSLRDVPQRRKLLIFVGRSVPIQSLGECGGQQREARTTLLRAAHVANLTIHVLDPSGLEVRIPDASQRTGISSPAMRNLIRQGNLSVLPDATGGRAVLNTNAPEERLFSIFRESSSYYVLGFEPATRKADGRFHEIRIKVNRPDTTVQARRGYYAAGGKTPPVPEAAAGAPASLVDAVAGMWPRNGVALSVAAAPFATPGGTGAAAAIVLHVRQDEAGIMGNVDVLAGAFDRFGRSAAYHRQTVSVSPPLNGAGEFEYDVVSRLPLKPGRYEIRVALEDASRTRTGSVYTYVDVPNFAKEPLSLSGAVVDAKPSPGAAPPVALADLLPVMPKTRRTFARSDEVKVFLRAYQGRSRGLSSVSFFTRIVDDTDRPVFQQTTPVRAVEFGADHAADYELEVPVERLRPGEYLLTIEAMAGISQVRRDLRFAVK